MKLNRLIFYMSFPIILTSCSKKLYLNAENQKKVLIKENQALSDENTILSKQLSDAKTENDSRTNSNSSLSAENLKLKNENSRLKKLAYDEVILVDTAMIRYFNAIAQITGHWGAPCTNAVNGFIRQFIAETDNDGSAGVNWKEKPVNHLADPALVLSTNDASNLLLIFKTFSLQNQQAFIANKNYDPGVWRAVKAMTLDYLTEIGKIVYDIIRIITSGGSDNELNQQLAIDVKNLFEKSRKDSNCHGGIHANGHIAAGVRTAASNALTALNNYNFSDSIPSLGKIKAILQKCFYELQLLEVQGHDPWLRPNWQLKYYAIIKATSVALSKLN